MESGIDTINENIIEEQLIQRRSKVSKKLIVGLVAAGLITITIATFLVGYFAFGWFQKPQDNVVQNTYHKDQVMLFKEVKTMRTEAKTKDQKDSVDQTITTDFLVMVNSKKKLNYFGEINHLYKATLVLLKMETTEGTIGGLNLLDKEAAEKFLKNPEQFEHPIAKFSFYENGTLVDIHIAKKTNQFSASSMVDLIEEIVPRISKKLYGKEENGVLFTYRDEKDAKTITEDHKEKEFVDKYSKVGFEGSKINKKITRKLVKDTITQVTIETEFTIDSDKPKNDEDFYDIGLEGYNFKVKSELNVVENKDDKDLVKNIELAIEKVDYEESQKLLEEFAKNEMKEIEELAKGDDIDKIDDPKDLRQLASSYTKTYKITSITILKKTIDFNLLLEFTENNGVCTFEAKIGGSSYKLYSKTLAKSGTLAKGSIDISLVKIPFQIGPIPLKFQLKAKGDYSLKYNIQAVSGDVKGTITAAANAYLDGSLSIGIKLASASLGVEGRVIGIEGSVTAALVARKLTASVNLYFGPVKIYVSAKLGFKKWKKTLYTSKYSTKKLV